MKKLKSIIIAPFDAAGARIHDTIKRTLFEIGIEVLCLDNIPSGASWVNAITEAIRNSDFIIFDVSRHNPNVYYELGYAHALRKPTILIIDKHSKGSLPSDLQGYLYIFYDPQNLSELRDNIKRLALQYIHRGGHEE